MPKNYEDEIREILNGVDRFPGEGRRRQRPKVPVPSFSLRGLDPYRIMGGAMLLVLLAMVLRIDRSPGMQTFANYVSIASFVLFVLGLFLSMRGSFGGAGSRPQMWRGQVIEFPRQGSPFEGLKRWYRRTTARFSRRPRGPRNRDSWQW